MRILIILCLLMVGAVYAKTPKINALHINGINTTNEEAFFNYIELHAVSEATIHTNLINWNYIYNPTKTDTTSDFMGLLKGWWDLFWQKYFDYNVTSTLEEFTIEAMKKEGLDYKIGSDEYKQFQSMLVAQYQDLILDYGGKNMKNIVDKFHNIVPVQYASVLELLGQDLQGDYSFSDDYVILLPHSQGNVYANNLYKYLTQTEHFNPLHITIFGFAPPDRYVAGNMSRPYYVNYVTSSNDAAIMSARVMTPGQVLQPNITIPKTNEDKIGHSLIKVYLADKTAVDYYNEYMFTSGLMFFYDIASKFGEYGMLYNDLAYIKEGNNDVICNRALCTKGHHFEVDDYIKKKYRFDRYTHYSLFLKDELKETISVYGGVMDNVYYPTTFNFETFNGKTSRFRTDFYKCKKNPIFEIKCPEYIYDEDPHDNFFANLSMSTVIHSEDFVDIKKDAPNLFEDDSLLFAKIFIHEDEGSFKK